MLVTFLKSRLRSEREAWLFYLAYFIGTLLSSFSLNLIGWLQISGELSSTVSLIFAGALVQTAIAFEVLRSKLNEAVAVPVRSLFLRASNQFKFGVICGIAGAFVWVVTFTFMLPQFETSGWLALLLLFCAFFIPPYLFPALALLIFRASRKRK